MKRKYVIKLKEVLEADNFNSLDQLLESVLYGDLTEDEVNELDEILNEATLYAEFKEAEYKEQALKLIDLIV